jgi:hypothetical protein
MELGAKGLDLLEQAIDEFLRSADGQRRDVVDRLVRVELGALPARVSQRVHDVGLDAEQPELEDLEETRRASADDHDVGGDGLAGGGGCRPRFGVGHGRVSGMDR